MTNAQCNTNTSICTSNAGPFKFSTPGAKVSSCLDFWGPGYAYIILYISQNGPLELLIDGNANSGYLDVAIFNIPSGESPCDAIKDNSNEISCNYANYANGCNQIGNYFGCTSKVSSPNVNEGDRLMIVVEDWSNLASNFILKLAPSPSAQSSPANATINPVSTTLMTGCQPYQMTAEDNGGVWSGPESWSGNEISSSGLLDPSLTGAGTFIIDYKIGIDACKSKDFYEITVLENNIIGTDVITACNTYTWIDGNTYTTSNNTATHTLTNAADCDSVVTLDLTINNSNTGTDVITACDTYTWIDGNTYTTSNNTATHTLLNAANCDSVVTLDLTINNSNTGTDVITVCDNYTWIDGITYTTSNNTATHTLLNVTNCDSVVTLDLTINNSNTGTDEITACETYT
ncbi:MAG: hypothetical protein HRT71_16995 [Flavobacteriales bacterium]|nr:hypothetical protein [Flavobacteriales bacterium]